MVISAHRSQLGASQVPVQLQTGLSADVVAAWRETVFHQSPLPKGKNQRPGILPPVIPGKLRNRDLSVADAALMKIVLREQCREVVTRTPQEMHAPRHIIGVVV